MDVLSNEALLDLQHMLSDKDFLAIFLDGEELSKYRIINQDGSVTLGKTKFKLINKLFNGEKTLSCNDVCIKLIQIITGKQGAKNKEAFKSLFKDFSDALDKKNYSYAITRIFIGYRLAFKKDLNVVDGTDDTYVSKDGKEKYLCADGIAIKDGTGQVYFMRVK